ncbi:sulfatase [Haloferula sp. A504]|uniref:sulfatase n=1 Tax=Haloferula sp. A504 TaxID=3373601 RepID=UPI0031C20E46|nr:sulfatase [Verrucomicrobiaceae bacterium E54]
MKPIRIHLWLLCWLAPAVWGQATDGQAAEGGAPDSDSANARPNILFCIADDWGYHFPGVGGKMPKTPTFERIAAQGMRFTNAHAPAPSCTPTRNAILTGAHPWKLGRGANLFSRFPEGFVTYPNLLAESGYHVGYNGKCFGPGKVPAGMPDPGVKSYGFPQNPGAFQAFLEDRKPGQPFCYWFGAQDPHRDYDRRLTRELGIGPEDVEVPPTFPDVEEVRWDIADYYAEVQRFDTLTGRHLEILAEQGLLDNTLIVVTSDHGWPFPRGKCNLYDAGTHVPLAVMWPGRVQAGQTVEDFVNLADLAPTFLEVAGLPRPGQMTTRSLLGVLESVPRAGLRDPARDHVFTFKERHCPSQWDTIGGYPMRAIHTKDYLYILNLEPDWWPVGCRLPSIRGQHYADIDPGPTKEIFVRNTPDMTHLDPPFSLTVAKRPADELYHTPDDPHQLHNLAGDPQYAGILQQLKSRLIDRLTADQDPRLLGKPEIYEFEPFLLQHDAKRFGELKRQRMEEPGRGNKP